MLAFLFLLSLRHAQGAKTEEVSPLEDLMREHGLLRRIMLIYDHEAHLIYQRQKHDDEVIEKSAILVRDFIEGYHEKLEEEHVFPVLEKAHTMTDLTQTLRAQHQASRKITQEILETAKGKNSGKESTKLVDSLRAFNRVYRPHAAREDTELFPAFKKKLSEKEYDEMGDLFEKREVKLFGKDGFENKLREVADLEKKAGINDLKLFTPA